MGWVSYSGSSAGEKFIRSTRFISIGSGTSGTLTIPDEGTIVLDDFGGTVDAVVTTISGGRPQFAQASEADSTLITATLDTDGNWTISGTPSAYPVALIYRVKQRLKDFDSEATDIVGEYDIEEAGGASSAADVSYSNGTSGLSATDVQDAIDETEARVDLLEAGYWRPSASRPLAFLSPDKGHLIRANYAWTAIGQDSASWIQATSNGTSDINATSGVSDGINQRYIKQVNSNTGYITLSSYGLATDGFCINSDIEFEAYIRVRLPALSDGTNTYTYRFGHTNQTTGTACTHGAEFVYDQSTSDNWICRTALASTPTETTSSIVVDEDEWIELFIRHDSSGTPSFKFYVNQTLAVTHTTNLPIETVPRGHVATSVAKSAHTAVTNTYTSGFQMALYIA